MEPSSGPHDGPPTPAREGQPPACHEPTQNAGFLGLRPFSPLSRNLPGCPPSTAPIPMGAPRHPEIPPVLRPTLGTSLRLGSIVVLLWRSFGGGDRLFLLSSSATQGKGGVLELAPEFIIASNQGQVFVQAEAVQHIGIGA